jgi:hypothetical protein
MCELLVYNNCIYVQYVWQVISWEIDDRWHLITVLKNQPISAIRGSALCELRSLAALVSGDARPYAAAVGTLAGGQLVGIVRHQETRKGIAHQQRIVAPPSAEFSLFKAYFPTTLILPRPRMAIAISPSAIKNKAQLFMVGTGATGTARYSHAPTPGILAAVTSTTSVLLFGGT